jgi:hypothetical protein
VRLAAERRSLLLIWKPSRLAIRPSDCLATADRSHLRALVVICPRADGLSLGVETSNFTFNKDGLRSFPGQWSALTLRVTPPNGKV